MMNRSALLLLLLLADASRGELQKRVTNGEDCKDDEGTHHVVLTVKDDKGKPSPKFHCGGSLIGNQWVLTAAHCKKTNLVAILHEHPQATQRVIADIEDIPYIYKDSNNKLHDIMLLKLKEVPKSNLPKIKLPDHNNCKSPSIGTEVRFTGRFTSTNTQVRVTKGPSIPQDKLLCGDLTVIDCPDFSKYKKHKSYLLRSYSYEWLLCAKDPKIPPKVDACKGDSGGGMTVMEGGVDVLYGVLKSINDYVCGSPVKFLDICRYRAWIHEKTGL